MGKRLACHPGYAGCGTPHMEAGNTMPVATEEKRYVGQVILEEEGTEDEWRYVVTAADVARDVLGAAVAAQAPPASGKGSRRRILKGLTPIEHVANTLDIIQ